MNIPGLITNHIAEAAIAAFRIVKFGATDGSALQAASVSNFSFGVSGKLPAATADRIDIIRTGIAEVEYGGVVTRGALLTSDADGKAIVAAPAGGTNNRIIGIAEVSGVSGDIGSVALMPTQIQG